VGAASEDVPGPASVGVAQGRQPNCVGQL
jgi:hypothetical protein